jgi:hypothetical protein
MSASQRLSAHTGRFYALTRLPNPSAEGEEFILDRHGPATTTCRTTIVAGEPRRDMQEPRTTSALFARVCRQKLHAALCSAGSVQRMQIAFMGQIAGRRVVVRTFRPRRSISRGTRRSTRSLRSLRSASTEPRGRDRGCPTAPPCRRFYTQDIVEAVTEYRCPTRRRVPAESSCISLG